MANRYWVGGSATWDLVNTSVWSATSGGPGGASVPTAADNVFFDQPGPYTISTDPLNEVPCYDFTVSAGEYTIGPGLLGVYGSFTLHPTTVYQRNILMRGTDARTLTANGADLSARSYFHNSASYVTLGSALTISAFNTMLSGVFDSAGYAISMLSFVPGSSSAGTVNWRNSALTVRGSGAVFISTSSSFTMLADPSSTLTFTQTSVTNITISFGLTNNAIQIPRVRASLSGATLGFSLPLNNVVYDLSCAAPIAKTFQFFGSFPVRFASINLRGTPGNLFSFRSSAVGVARQVYKSGPWYMGANSINVSNNSNLAFTDGSALDYLSVQDITGVSLPTGNLLPFYF